jgi:hypothetical protein
MRDKQVRSLQTPFLCLSKGGHCFLLGRFELFLDLLYVAILANFAENLAENASGAGLGKYIVRITFRFRSENSS